MNEQPDEVVIVLHRYKIRQNAFSTVGKRNIVASVESQYARRNKPTAVLKSADQRAVPGCEFYVPWAETITGLTMHISALQDRLTCYIGEVEIVSEYFTTKPSTLNMYIRNCGEIVGSASVSVSVRQIFHEKGSLINPIQPALKARSKYVTEPEHAGAYCAPVDSGFRFNRLSRPINWERLRCVNLRR